MACQPTLGRAAASILIFLSTCSAQYGNSYGNGYRNGWRGSYSAGVVVAIAGFLLILFSCCLITRRRRRFALRANPATKPPLFGRAPPPGYSPGYSLPFWHKPEYYPQGQHNGPSQLNTGSPHGTTGTPYDNDQHNGGQMSAGTSGGYQPPAPVHQASGDAPPPPYGKVTNPVGNETYAPPPGPPPQAHMANETNHFIGGFREQH